MTGPGSGNVMLRPIAEGDWPAVHAWASQDRVCRYQPWGPNTAQQTREFVRDAASAWISLRPTRFVYAITLHGPAVGNCELNLRGQDQGEISYALHPTTGDRGWPQPLPASSSSSCSTSTTCTASSPPATRATSRQLPSCNGSGCTMRAGCARRADPRRMARLRPVQRPRTRVEWPGVPDACPAVAQPGPAVGNDLLE